MRNEAPIPITRSIAASLAHYTRSGIAAYWFSFFILIFIEFFLGGQLSHLLTKENYATYISILNTLPLYNVLSNAGIAYGIMYMASYNPAGRFALLSQAVKTQAIWYALLVALHTIVWYAYGSTYPAILLVTIIITYTYSYRLNLTSFFIASGSYYKAAAANVVQKTALLLVFLFTFYSAPFNNIINARFSVAYTIIELAMMGLYVVLFYKTNAAAFAAPAINYSSRLKKYGKYAAVNNGLNVLYYSIIALIIRHSGISTHKQIILGLCIVFFRYTAIAIAPVFPTLNPQLTRLKNDIPSVIRMYRKYFLFILLASIGTMVGCRLCFGYIITAFYAHSYHDLPLYFNSFCYLIPLLFINSFNASAMAALGRIKFTAVAEVVCTVLLLLVLAYEIASPITDYHYIYYIVLLHLSVKFLLLAFGTYKTLSILKP